MQFIKLGNSDLQVSRICMGFSDAARGQHSWTLDEESSRRIILDRVVLLTSQKGISMTEVSLAWLLAKTAASVADVMAQNTPAV